MLRGGGGLNPGASPFFPAPTDDLFTFTDLGSGTLDINLIDPGSAPATGFRGQVSVNGSPFGDMGWTSADGVLENTPGVGGDTYDVQLAWCDVDTGSLESPWSATHTIVMS
jgi:hypothetical protein